MPIDQLRRTLKPLVDELPIPTPWDIFRLVEEIGRARGRPIMLLPTATSDGVCGMYLATLAADYIAYEPDTPPPHRDHIIAHELAHILLGDGGRALHDETPAPMRYSEYVERRAEVFASLVLQRAPGRAPSPPADDVRAVLTTFEPMPMGAVGGGPAHPACVRRGGVRGVGPLAQPG